MLALVLLAQLAVPQPLPPATRFELRNGLRVWVQEDHRRPVALVRVTYKVGSLNETAGATGIAHYVEHMVYRATENVRNEDVYGYIDRIGGRYTGGTWPDATRYEELVPAWALESALRVTAERMTRARFDSLEFERERSNVVTEAHGFTERDAVSAFNDSLLALAFETHPYRHTSNTWARDNLRLTRAQAVEWYRRHYGPNNAVLVIAGDVEPGAVRRLVEKHFASLPRVPAGGAIAIVEPPQNAERRLTMRHGGDETRVQLLYRAPTASQPEYSTLVALDRVLGPALARAAERLGRDVSITTQDSAAAYPFVYRISARGTGVHADSLLAAIETEVAALTSLAQLPGVDVHLTPVEERAGPSLTDVADALESREVFPGDLSPAQRDSIAPRVSRTDAAEIAAYARTWLVPSQRTVGVLLPGGGGPDERMDIPPMTTPPARRLRPDPVPNRALEPLAPLAIERQRWRLRNGVVVRAARVAGAEAVLRVVRDWGSASDTMVHRFAWSSADSAIRRARDSLATRASERLAIGIAGPVDPMQLAAAVERRLSDVVVAAPRVAERHREPPTPRIETVPVARARQVEIAATLPGAPRGSPHRRALELLNYIVGVPSYGGRLGWALTKTGLTYSSSATTTFGDAGRILFTTTADTRNTEETIQAIREVVEGIATDGVEEWELREAKAFMLGRTLLYGAREDSGPDAIAAALAASEDAELDLLDLPALSRAYLSVTLEEVNRAARLYYRPDMLKIVATGAVPARAEPSHFAPGTFRKLFEPRR